MEKEIENLVPAWLVAEREQPQQETAFVERQQIAREYLITHGLPTSAIEDWKYTSLRSLASIPFSWANAQRAPEIELSGLPFSSADNYRVVIVDGRYYPEVSRLPEQRVTVVSSVGKVANSSLKVIGSDSNFTEELNLAHINEVTIITVAPGSIIKTPIELLIVNSPGCNEAVAARVAFYIGANSELEITELHHNIKAAGPSLISYVSEYELAENSRVKFFKLVQQGEQQYSFVATKVFQAQDSKFQHSSFFTDTRLYRNEMYVGMNGQGAECNLNNLSVMSREQHVDNYTIITHQAPNCCSNQRFKGIYNGSAQGVFTGTIVVQPGAQKTNAYQSNANLLLSPEAKVDARPQLKIWADDVKCTHGEACGQLDEEALFYLQARGISKAEAKKILVRSFAQEIIDTISDMVIKDALEQMVMRAL